MGFLDRLFVEICPSCGGSSAAGLCRVCASRVARVRDACGVCGLERPVARCPKHAVGWRIAAVAAPFVYAPPLDDLIHSLKYRGARRLGRTLALLTVGALGERRGDVDALAPVPLHPRRLRARGYNQATEIARVLGTELGLPLLLRGVRRRTDAGPQARLPADERVSNVAAAFAVDRSLAGLRVAIVDDVITTGATVNALAGALLDAGAARCEAWAVARTPETLGYANR
jgi:ComF family protein